MCVCRTAPGVETLLDQLAGAGFRVLALAQGTVDAQPTCGESDEKQFVPDGFLVFADPPKEDAAEAIGRPRRLLAMTATYLGLVEVGKAIFSGRARRRVA